MNVSLVITGTYKWNEYTLPFIQSIQKYAPEFHIVCVDNGSSYPDYPDVQFVKLNNIEPYPKVLNEGIKAYKADWYFLCNNDMLITKPLSVNRFERLRNECLYSWIMVSKKTVGFEYLESFSMFVSQYTIDTIGYFDENFVPMWFEGADYCYRALKAGLELASPLNREDWGVYHIEDERMDERKAYMAEHIQQRQANRLYLWKKHHLFGY